MSESAVSFSAIYVVWLRHFKVYTKTLFVNCIAPITEPAFYLLAFGLGMGPLIGSIQVQGEAVAYTTFLVPGMIAVGVLFQSFLEGAYCVYHRIHYQKTWTSMLAAPLSYTDVYLGDLFWAATRGVVAGIFTALVALGFGMYDLKSMLLALPTMLIAAVMFAALGLCSTALAQRIDQINIPIYLVCVPMFVFCGTYFPRSTLPVPLDTISNWLPLSPVVDLLRRDLNFHGGVIAVTEVLIWTAILVWFSWYRLKLKIFR